MRDLPEQLTASWKVLDEQWSRSRGVWRDSVRQQFARDYSMPIEESTRAMIQASESMSQTLMRMERELPPEG